MSSDLFGQERAPRRSMMSHESNSGGTDEWLTPPDLIAALGSFDLDPCSPTNRPWDTADRHYTIADDGLRQQWRGRVWMNPPYANAGKWMRRMAEHGHGTALLFVRSETALWQDHVWPHATALLFLRGRLTFHHSGTGARAKSPAGAPSALIAYGHADAKALQTSCLAGAYVDLGGAA